MSGIASFAIFSVNQLKVEFRDEIGNPKTITGTGFWLDKGPTRYFITNAHNINPKMKLGPDTTFVLHKLWIKLRQNLLGEWRPNTKWFEVRISAQTKIHKTADVAAIIAPEFLENLGMYSISTYLFDNLANQTFLHTCLRPMDVASFIGFPGSKGIPWYDQQWEVAIARTVNLSSFPGLSFHNTLIPTSDAMLVSGLSFSGSSGSPVISHEKGIQLGAGLTGGNYTPPKIIGVMSGHWWDEAASSEMVSHSGLSYLTRSTSIIEILI